MPGIKKIKAKKRTVKKKSFTIRKAKKNSKKGKVKGFVSRFYARYGEMMSKLSNE